MKKFFNRLINGMASLVMLVAALGLVATSSIYLISKMQFFEYTEVVGATVVTRPTPAAFGWIWWISLAVLAAIFLIRPLRKAATDPF